MTNVPDRPPGANAPDPPVPVDLADPAARVRWLAAARSQLEDLILAAKDQTDPLAAREMGRAYARRVIDEAGAALRRLLDDVGAPPTPEADRMACGLAAPRTPEADRPPPEGDRLRLARGPVARRRAIRRRRDDAVLVAGLSFEPNPNEPPSPFTRALFTFMRDDTPENEAALREAATAGGGDPDIIIANLRSERGAP